MHTWFKPFVMTLCCSSQRVQFVEARLESFLQGISEHRMLLARKSARFHVTLQLNTFRRNADELEIRHRLHGSIAPIRTGKPYVGGG